MNDVNDAANENTDEGVTPFDPSTLGPLPAQLDPAIKSFEQEAKQLQDRLQWLNQAIEDTKAYSEEMLYLQKSDMTSFQTKVGEYFIRMGINAALFKTKPGKMADASEAEIMAVFKDFPEPTTDTIRRQVFGKEHLATINKLIEAKKIERLGTGRGTKYRKLP